MSSIDNDTFRLIDLHKMAAGCCDGLVAEWMLAIEARQRHFDAMLADDIARRERRNQLDGDHIQSGDPAANDLASTQSH
jgi:hypothetical protein